MNKKTGRDLYVAENKKKKFTKFQIFFMGLISTVNDLPGDPFVSWYDVQIYC